MSSDDTIVRVESDSPSRTQALARGLARWLRPGSVVCLRGDLGAGKTLFVGGLVQALGGQGPVVSPTFTLENRYAVAGAVRELVHVDLYRAESDAVEDLVGSMIEARSDGAVVTIEWATPVQERLLPYLEVVFDMVPARPQSRLMALNANPVGWKHHEAVRAAWLAEGVVAT